MWPSTEHYFQAQKFINTDPSWAEVIRTTQKPGASATMGKSRSHPIAPNWEDIKQLGRYQI
ncbi:hypothetical protein LCGC14_0469530 [marine sediment metagenome]|uniref:Uncharacterized protein n=1 Tax=marine sediment metagenome TaxID=412755 RepID=A0A0F9VLE1_9ZZZZ